MRVPCEVVELLPVGGGDRPNGVEVTCLRCYHCTRSHGTSESSVRRALALLRDECPHHEFNFYVEAREEEIP